MKSLNLALKMIRGNRDFYITIKLNTGQKTNGVDDKCKKG